MAALMLAPAAGWAQTSDLDPDDPEYEAAQTEEGPSTSAGGGAPTTPPGGAAASGQTESGGGDGAAQAAQAPMKDYIVELVGSHEYWRFRDAKEKIQAQIPEGVEVMVKKVSRGRIVYAMKARVGMEELLARLGGLPLRKGQLAILGTNENSLRLEIQ